MENDRKTQIIKAAIKRFARHGRNKTTLDEIARDLRIGKATIYHYFNSKEDLYYATLEWDASLYIEDIKKIFNSEELEIKERFVEYYQYKETLLERYKLLYDMIASLLGDNTYERESETIKKLLTDEEKILELALSSVYSGKIESMNPELPSFIVMTSWGLMLGSRLQLVSDSEKKLNLRQMIDKCLQNIFT